MGMELQYQRLKMTHEVLSGLKTEGKGSYRKENIRPCQSGAYESEPAANITPPRK